MDNINDLKEQSCMPAHNLKKLTNIREIAEIKSNLITQWEVKDNSILMKSFNFENFKRAMSFVQEVAIIAEAEQHHPDINIRFNMVKIKLTTKDLGGLTMNDFIMAAKIEDL